MSRPRSPDSHALVVLAGQQPVIGGGAALVVHKAATAVALARLASETLARPVVPVFLLATQDHDGPEVDHLDLYDPPSRSLTRLRCPVRPGHDMFARSTWDKTGMVSFSDELSRLLNDQSGLSELVHGAPDEPLADHVARLVDQVLGPAGLVIVEAHRLEPDGRAVLSRALSEPGGPAAELTAGAALLRERGLRPAFDPADPRPLVLESRGGRRTRIEPDDAGALDRHRANPEDFSPHASLRPVVQALGLPVIAQVVGPSELVYLAQARSLHDLFAAPAPLLVPRLEATRAPLELVRSMGERLLDDAPPISDAEQRLDEAAERFARGLAALDPSLAPRLDRFVAGLRARARRLAAQPAWRGRAARGSRAMVRPRGRWQDSVLAWLPDACSTADPADYGRFLVSLARPFEPPVHVIHTFPEFADG